MPDIVDRLRRCRWKKDMWYSDTYDLTGVEAERLEAADTIIRLRAHNMDQATFNRKVIDVLDQLYQELVRIRAGKTLSNTQGIRQQIDELVADGVVNERTKPTPVSFKGG